MTIIDITRPIVPGMEVYPGDPEVAFEAVKSIAAGGSCNLTRLTFGSHTSTHMDAPLHFVDGGGPVDEVPLGVLIGPAVVLAVPGEVAGRADLETAGIGGVERLVLKGPSGGEGVSIGPDAAAYLVESGVRLVATESPSVEPPGTSRDTHKTLLGAGVVVVEGVDLSGARPGGYELVCLPLKLAGCDGSPVRAALIVR